MVDLNDHLYEALEWLSDRDITGEKFTEEVVRANTICNVAIQITSSRRLKLDMIKTVADWPDTEKKLALLE
jgi:hypothetical protein